MLDIDALKGSQETNEYITMNAPETVIKYKTQIGKNTLKVNGGIQCKYFQQKFLTKN